MESGPGTCARPTKSWAIGADAGTAAGTAAEKSQGRPATGANPSSTTPPSITAGLVGSADSIEMVAPLSESAGLEAAGGALILSVLGR